MIYVDTSVIVALLIVEPKTPDVTAWYADLRLAPVSRSAYSQAAHGKNRVGWCCYPLPRSYVLPLP